MSISLEKVRTLSGQKVDTVVSNSMRNGAAVCIWGPSGGGKTERMVALDRRLPANFFEGAPAFAGFFARTGGWPTGLATVAINLASMDEYRFPGLALPTDVEVRGDVGQPAWLGDRATLGTTSQPVWLAQLIHVARQPGNEGKVVNLFFDEVNTAPAQMQAQLLQLLSERKVENWRVPADIADRLAVTMAGNRPEDHPATFTLSGPLAKRVLHFVQQISAKEWLQYMDESGRSNALVSAVLEERPDLMFVGAVDDDGAVPQLRDDLSSEIDWSATTPIANALCPRTWALLSDILNDMAVRGVPVEDQLLVAAGTAPKEIVDLLAVQHRLAESFASWSAVIDDPAGAAVPDSPLLQSMQLRALSAHLRLQDTSAGEAERVVVYCRRLQTQVMSAFVKRIRAVSNPAPALAVVRDAFSSSSTADTLRALGYGDKVDAALKRKAAKAKAAPPPIDDDLDLDLDF